MKKLIQNIKMAGLMAMALIAWPTTITAQSAKYDAKTVNAVTERFVAYAKINSQGTDTSDMDAFPLNPGQREMARKVEADLQAILRGTSATVTRSESEYVYVKIPANAKGIPSVMFMAHLDVTPEAPGGNITPVIHRGYDGGDLHLPSGLVLSPTTPQGRHLAQCVGKTVITSDGSTVLGADDKTGCTVLVTLIERITRNRKMRHGDLYFVFSQNEDIGRAADRFEVKYVGGGSPDVVIDIDGDAPTHFSVANFTAVGRTYRFRRKGSTSRRRIRQQVRRRADGSGLLHRTNCAAETSVGKPWRAGIHTLLHHDARGDHGRRKLDGGECACAILTSSRATRSAPCSMMPRLP